MENKKKGSKDTLGDRMKGYENAYRFYLPRRMPVIIRIDGRAFHTFTRGLQNHLIAVLSKSCKTLLSNSLVKSRAARWAMFSQMRLAYWLPTTTLWRPSLGLPTISRNS